MILLAAPARRFDLRRGCSLVEHLVDAWRPPDQPLVEYGEASLRQPRPRHGALGRRGDPPGHPGGQRGRRHARAADLLAGCRDLAADQPMSGPADRIPDQRRRPGLRHPGAAGRPDPAVPGLAERAGLVTQSYRLMGTLLQAAVRRAFQLSSFSNKLVTKLIAISAKLYDKDFLAQVQAVDRFTANMIAYPGLDLRAALPPVAQGQPARVRVGHDYDRTISLADTTTRCSPSAGPVTTSPRCRPCGRSSTWSPASSTCASRSCPAGTSAC